MEKKINKKKIVKYAAAGLLTATLATGIGISICDAGVDHYNEFCPLNYVFGVYHQVHAINNDQDVSTYATYLEDGIMRFYGEAEEKTIYIAPDSYILGNDGMAYRYLADGTVESVPAIQKTVFVAPEGFVLQGDKIYKDVRYAEDDAILICQGEVIYPEGSQPGDIVKKADLDYGESEVISVIEVPKRTR